MAQRVKTDWILFLTVLVMVTFGLVVVYSASSVVAELRYDERSYYFLVRQVIAALLGFGLLMLIKNRDYKSLRTPTWVFGLLGVVLMLLVAVYFTDPRTRRWIRFGPAQFQPSEFAKPILIIFLAYIVSKRAFMINNRHTLLSAALAVVAVVGIVAFPDLGTAIVLAVTATVMFCVAGLERRFIAGALIAAALAGGLLILAKPYRLIRVLGYFDPEYKILERFDRNGMIQRYATSTLASRDPNYQARQSRIAIGAGGVLGVGLMQGKQKLLYLPEAHTDFIYAVIGEELGFWGCTAVLAGFLVILWRGMRLYLYAADDFGRYLALGVTSCIVFQALFHITVVLGIGPTKGIPLPMISYGGSSLVSTLASLGLLLSVSERTG